MPSRKSDQPRKSDASSSVARFAPIDSSASPAPAPAPAPATPVAANAPPPPTPPPPALALPTMDTSMPPPSLPPPGTSQTPIEAMPVLARSNANNAASAASVPSVGTANQAHSTPSEKGKDKEEKSGPGGHPKEAITIPIEELQLPKSIITRLAKGVLPPNTQIQANAILAMTKSTTVFINHLANAANEVTALGGKRTIMPADVFRALDEIELGFMRERVEAEFEKFNETQTTKRSAYRKKVAAAKKATKGPGEEGGDTSMADTSMADTEGDTTMAGGADTTVNSAAGDPGSGSAGAGAGAGAAGSQQPRAKKARTDGAGNQDAQMDVDDEMNDASDPEDVPIEDEEEDDAQEEDEEEEEDDDGGDDDDNNGEEQDELEEQEDQPDEDEALDDGNHSD